MHNQIKLFVDHTVVTFEYLAATKKTIIDEIGNTMECMKNPCNTLRSGIEIVQVREQCDAVRYVHMYMCMYLHVYMYLVCSVMTFATERQVKAATVCMLLPTADWTWIKQICLVTTMLLHTRTIIHTCTVNCTYSTCTPAHVQCTCTCTRVYAAV